MNRKDLLLANDFFKDKENLVDEILANEKKSLLSLPSTFSYKQTSKVELNGVDISLLRLNNFYALELSNLDNKRYQLFENEIVLKKFILNNANDENVSKFWLRQLELICD